MTPSHPTTPAPIFENLPEDLIVLPQWVLWHFVYREGKDGGSGKWTKLPVQANGKPASSTDPKTWATFADVRRAFDQSGGKFAGVGFVFSPDDQYFGIDMDGCLDPVTNVFTEDADRWISEFSTYAEVSPSGTGVKLIGVGALPEGMSGRRDAAAGVEAYDQARFFTITGRRLPDFPATCEPAQETLSAFLTTYFPKAIAKSQNQAPARPVTPLEMDDAALLAKAFSSVNGARFSALWNGSTAGYPGASEADMAMAGMLLFWTQGDVRRTEEVMRRSQLYREKWDDKRGGGTYLTYTISKAAEGKTEFYDPQARKTAQKENFENNEKVSLKGYVDRGIEEEEEEEVNTYSISNNFSKFSKLENDSWDSEPIPFGRENLPSFPSERLPLVLRTFAEQVAGSVGTSADLPGVQVLAAIAAAAQKSVSVQAKQGHIEPLTLWTIGIAPPGSRKSAIINYIRKPFTGFEARENERRRPDVERYESAERVAKSRLAKAESAAAKGNPSYEAQAELDTARADVSSLKPVRPMRLLADDATPEVLAIMLSENQGRLAVLDAEGAAFGHMIGRYSQNPAIEIYLKGHAGEDHTTDRAGGNGSARRTVFVPQAALTLGCLVQPEVLSDLRKKKELAGRGILARCLFSFSEDTDAADEYDTPEIPPATIKTYRALIEDLLCLSPTPDLDDDGQPVPHMIFLSSDARALFTEFYREIQKERRSEGEGLFAEWLAKLHGGTLRISGVLHMAKHGSAGARLEIEPDTMESAIELARYFMAHAQAALSRIREDEASEGALKILGWVKRNTGAVSEATDKQGGVSLRDLRQQLRGFDSQEELQAALFVLASRGYAREATMPERAEGTRGRKPTPRWQFHPSLTWEVEV